MKKNAGWFTRFANHAAQATGHPSAFVVAALVVLIWGITGPLFNFSDTWQLVINTGTTIITFLMVFLIQNTQNRDSAAIHLKLDELIRSHAQAKNSMLDLEHVSDFSRARRAECCVDVHQRTARRRRDGNIRRRAALSC